MKFPGPTVPGPSDPGPSGPGPSIPGPTDPGLIHDQHEPFLTHKFADSRFYDSRGSPIAVLPIPNRSYH